MILNKEEINSASSMPMSHDYGFSSAACHVTKAFQCDFLNLTTGRSVAFLACRHKHEDFIVIFCAI